MGHASRPTQFSSPTRILFNVSRKWPAAKKSARSEISDLLNWRPVVLDSNILVAGWVLQDRYGFSF